MDITWQQAAGILKRGGIIAFPTDTVYGLAVAIDQPQAITRLYEIKGRSSQKPLVVMCPDSASVKRLNVNWDADIEKLAVEHWPGALTLVFQRDRAVIPDQVAAGMPTIGVRIPAYQPLLGLLSILSGPLAVTSANVSGQKELLTAEEVSNIFGDTIDGIVRDDAAISSGVASTVFDVSKKPWKILRQGEIKIPE